MGWQMVGNSRHLDEERRREGEFVYSKMTVFCNFYPVNAHVVEKSTHNIVSEKCIGPKTFDFHVSTV